MPPEIHKDDWGIQFQDTIEDDDGVVDLSNYSTIQYIFRKPDGTQVTKDASYYTNGSDGMVKYIAESGLINQAGFWSYQLYTIISGVPTHTDLGSFRVFKNIGD